MTAWQEMIIASLQEAVTFPFYAAGWVTGAVVRAVVWCRDAIVAGYYDGRAKKDEDNL